MSVDIRFSKNAGKTTKAIILGLYEGQTAKTALDTPVQELDKKLNGFISHALASRKNFSGKCGQTLELTLPANADFDIAILLGLGKAQDLTALKAKEAGGRLYVALEKTGIPSAAFLSSSNKNLKNLKSEDLAANLAAGLKMRSYKFEIYKTPKEKNKTPIFSKFELICPHPANAKSLFEALSTVIDGTFWARNLVNEPPNHLHPGSFAKILKSELKPLGVEVEILDEKKMQKLNMGAILAVGMGSASPPRMVIMRWNGLSKTATSKNKSKPVILVGKGVTFDTGGISLKPGAGMDEMKMDMGGAAAVAGTIKALALRKAKADVIGIVGLAENMPSSEAYRPGDIIQSHAGKTIEILNTDAEGRLVLADCLSYAQELYEPRIIIDLATLTGAVLVALGHEYCGTFVNDDTLWTQMAKASEETGEKLWRMPLDEVWKKDVQSDVADLQNIGKSGRNAGSCVAAGFLNHFIKDGTPWAHMDIAGTAWRKSDQPTVPKFGTGFGVHILNKLIAEFYE